MEHPKPVKLSDFFVLFSQIHSLEIMCTSLFLRHFSRALPALVLMFVAVIAYSQTNSAKPTTIILIRHAEKVLTPPSNDPELSAEGLKRAEKLATFFQAVPFAALYATPFKRTVNTAQPLAKLSKLPIQRYEASSGVLFLDSLLRNYEGRTVLVVGHSNTIPSLLNQLVGSNEYEQLNDTDYDNIFVVAVARRGAASVTRLTFK